MNDAPGRPRLQWTQAQLTEMRNAYAAGSSTRALAAHFGVSHDTIRRQLKEAGIALRPRGAGPAQPVPVDQLHAMIDEYRAGDTINMLAVRHRFGTRRVRELLAAAGVDIRSHGGHRG